MPRTLYHVRDDRGLSWDTENPEHAERLSRAGFRVTASMGP